MGKEETGTDTAHRSRSRLRPQFMWDRATTWQLPSFVASPQKLTNIV